MKHGKKPTLRQKKLMKAARLKFENWLVISDTPEKMIVQNRQTNKTREIRKDLFNEC